jgi:outer membrane protein assembly factor BamB
MRTLLALLLLCSALPCRAGDKQWKDTREFGKTAGYKVKVDYEEMGGQGGARFSLLDPAGKVLSVFSETRAPFTVSISGDGKRLIAYNGWWSQSVSITNMCVYASDGRLLQKHKLSMAAPAGEDFSADQTVYAAGADQGETAAVYVLSTADGKMLWTKVFKEKINGLKLSGDGKRLLIIFRSGERAFRAALFNAAGEQLWQERISTRNNLFPRSINADGSAFELWEDRMLYKESDGYYHDTVLLKRGFGPGKNGPEELRQEKVKEEMK